MSVENSFCIVDWTYLTNHWSNESGHDVLADGLEGEATWVTPEPLNTSAEDMGQMILFSDYYHDVLAPLLPKSVEIDLAQFLSKLACLTQKDKFVPPQKLTESDDEWILGAIPPTTVAELKRLYDTIDMNLLLPHLKATIPSKECDWLTSVDQFTEMLESLGRLVTKAAEEGKGVLILAA